MKLGTADEDEVTVTVAAPSSDAASPTAITASVSQTNHEPSHTKSLEVLTLTPSIHTGCVTRDVMRGNAKNGYLLH